MVEYRVVGASTKDDHKLSDFEKVVNEFISIGWTPIGGVSVTPPHVKGGPKDWYFAQAMTREKRKQSTGPM